MNDLIKINYDRERPTVLGRDLHEMLEVETPYHKWFPRMCEYGFAENEDYAVTDKNVHNSNGGKQEVIDHQLTIEMSKELCMLQRTDKGKQCRQYFIQLETAWNTPEMVMSRALKMAENTISKLTTTVAVKDQIIGELQPKADYTDRILQNKGLVSVSQIAKDYGMSGQALNAKLHDLKVQYKQGNQWLLYSKYQACGYTHSKTIDIEHTDGRKDVVMETKWTQKGRLFIYELLKSNGILPVIER